jgi:hypothetical protein
MVRRHRIAALRPARGKVGGIGRKRADDRDVFRVITGQARWYRFAMQLGTQVQGRHQEHTRGSAEIWGCVVNGCLLSHTDVDAVSPKLSR